ncbi:TPA: peptidylprolyl isomerase [Candidatus Bathyarchaeota archaeon]|nr:peptidylprolyl isomerase [Candidatus Bathyarchaeota archaeon]HIJ08604.1 peptidylprolyl isomerase [Candidatus Bathyarchaeota archaeon]
MSLQKGDFILIDYNAKTKETGETFDTTNEGTAKTAHLHKEGETYEPKLVVVGEGWMLKPIDEAFPTMEPNKSATVEIPSEKAFGPRDPEKIKRVSLKQLYAKGIERPAIGARIEYGGKMATIRSIGAGRVLLDFNAPLAGRTLIYEITIQKKLETNDDKMIALIHRRIPIADQTKFRLAAEPNTLTIEMPEETFYLEGIQVAKRGVAMDIQKFFPETTAVKFVEIHKTEPAKP